MNRTSFGQQDKKRLFCVGSEKLPSCRNYLTTLYRNQIGRPVSKVCKNCGTIWVINVREGILEDGNFGVIIEFNNQDVVKLYTSPY